MISVKLEIRIRDEEGIYWYFDNLSKIVKVIQLKIIKYKKMTYFFFMKDWKFIDVSKPVYDCFSF